MLNRMSIVALLAVSVAAGSVVLGQVRVENGRANDGNNRVGSGGYNAGRGNNPYLPTPNDIALGNVTGGRGFRGNITPDPSQPFGGRSGLASDQIARRSNAGATSAAPPVRPGTYASRYYSTSPVGNAPGNFVINPYTGQYQPTQQVVRGGEDLQFGVPPGTPVIRPGVDGGSQLVLPAVARDANGAAIPTLMTATPLLGIRMMPNMMDEDRFLLSRSSGLVGQINEPLTPATLKKLREELRQTMMTDPRVGEALNRVEDSLTADLTKQAQGQAQGQALIQGNRVDPTLPDATLPNNPFGAPENTRKKSTVVDPAEFNPLLRELRKREEERAERLKEEAAAKEREPAAPARGGVRNPALGTPQEKTPQDKPPTDQAPTDTNRDNPVAPPAAGPSGGTVPVPGGTTPVPESATPAGRAVEGAPARNPMENAPVNPGPGAVGYIPPIRVDSLAERQSREGMKELLGSAERLMKEGRYATAADRYATAMRYAPGDATVMVARAQAELGAGFFARAEAQLRRAVEADPSVLGAQYDLRQLMGEKRVDTLVSDLKKLALDERESSMPVLLLAYLAYNGGENESAREKVTLLLNEAANRNKSDRLITAMRTHWFGDDNK